MMAMTCLYIRKMHHVMIEKLLKFSGVSLDGGMGDSAFKLYRTIG